MTTPEILPRSGPLDNDHYVLVSALCIACDLIQWIIEAGGNKKARNYECIDFLEHIETHPRIKQLLDEVSETSSQIVKQRKAQAN